jgi:polysaccharide export outer membrane protein
MNAHEARMKRSLAPAAVAALFALPLGGTRADSPAAPAKPATAAPTRPAAVAVSPAYRVSAGDTLRVNVLDMPELSDVFTVNPDGRITYPYAGEVKVEGMTVAEVARKLKASLAKQVASPQVNVSVAERHVGYVSALGAVKTPGKVAMGDNWRVLDLLTAAGGLSVGRPEWASATLVRAGGESAVPVDLKKVVGTADPEANLPVREGDILMVNAVDASQTRIQVRGVVKNPGYLPATGATTVADVLDAVGGILPGAARSQAYIERGTEKIPVDLTTVGQAGQPQPTVQLFPGDVLNVPANPRQYAVIGAVANPGPQPYPETDTMSVLSALMRAGGAAPNADLKKAAIVSKPAPGVDPVVRPIDLEKTFKDAMEGKQGDRKDDKKGSGTLSQEAPSLALQPGDVLYVPSKGEGRKGGFFQNVIGALGAVGSVGWLFL